MQKQVRINKFLSEAGVCARRKADELIKQGRVKINGVTAIEGQKVLEESDVVEVDGKIIKIQEDRVYYLLNKPSKILSAVSDERGKRTVIELIKDKRKIFPIGRLDYETEGLIILTNDGELYNRVIHPRAEVFKTYFAIIEGEIKDEEIRRLIEGVNIDGETTLPARVKLIKRTSINSEIEISIREGRNRQIRKMCKAIRHEVIYLKRLSIGEIKLGNLSIGEYRELTEDEYNYLKNL